MFGRLLLRCSLLVFTLGTLNPGLAAPVSELVRREFYVMGTTLALELDAANRELGLLRLEAMIGIVEATESELSTWSETSALSRLNQQAVGVPLQTDASLCQLLSELDYWSDRTGRAFDPAVGALIDVWGLRAVPRVPGAQELESALRRTGLNLLGLDPTTCLAIRLGDVSLDAGAFGKGEALDRVAAGAGRNAWMADFGGQIMVYAPPGSEAAWTVALAHPRVRDDAAVEVTLSEGSLATSGGSERDTETPTGPVGHILDPRTGQALARSESVVVWHREALVADILSTALYVMGVDAGLDWAESEGIAACFLVPDGDEVRLRATAAFRERFQL